MKKEIEDMVFERVVRITGNKLLERLKWSIDSDEFANYFKSLSENDIRTFIFSDAFTDSLDSVIDDCLDSHLRELNYQFDWHGSEGALKNYLNENDE